MYLLGNEQKGILDSFQKISLTILLSKYGMVFDNNQMINES
jgi:hypothetical protein